MDNKGRLWGKISVIDILLILLVLVVAGGFAYKNITSDPVVSYANGDPAMMRVKLTNMDDYYLDALSEGQVLYNPDDEQIGVIRQIETSPATSLTDGYVGATQIKKVPVADLSDIYLDLEVSCFTDEMSYLINGEDVVSVGSSLTLQNANVYLTDASVERITFAA